ncbi:hypothetical protein ATE47_01575 [Chryseobacterium sp. IHB B 17019]|uniref:O-antigen ligase family protein n=1 Tax=Chryseobacterium sp. IHB B 17019 TaxID=1721091 RepID=UPI000721AF4C|nr:O-antigen ligase family protein [Chryseobacterium sp. IHB B 17019]ALR29301.1 hypothetical protein ATE47_01575 [Chryseobacterium sp. IHB B 17019]
MKLQLGVNFFKTSYTFFLESIVLFIGLIISIYFESRAFSIGFITAIVTIFILLRKIRFTAGIYLLIFSFFFLLTLYTVFYVKTGSSFGRIFIYKISFNIFKDNWLLGVGFGKFKTTYMYYQANYFKQGNYNTSEFLLADNTYFAFNDYFQFIIETGLVGISFIILMMIGLIKFIKTLTACYDSPIVLTAVGVIIAISVAAFFTYVFNKLFFQVVYVVCFSVCFLFAYDKRQRGLTIIPIGSVFLFLVIGASYNFNSKNLFASQKLKHVRQLAQAGYKTEANKILNDIAGEISHDAEYLELSSYMKVSGMDLTNAEKATLKLIDIRPSSTAFLRLGNIYEINHRFKEAEFAYKLAIDMVPNRVMSRYKLYQFYASTKQVKNANKTAVQILNMPIKVPSLLIDQIKNELTKDINL